LPLWFDNEDGEFHFFGGDFPEDRYFWFDILLFPEVFKALPNNITLYDINEYSVQGVSSTFPDYQTNFICDESHYYVETSVMKEMNDYLKSYGKKHRKNLMHDLKGLEKLGVKAEWHRLANYEEFVHFNVERFGNESDFDDAVFVAQFKRMLECFNELKMLYTVTLLLDNNVVGVMYAAHYRDVYYVLNGGYNRNVKNLGKRMVWEHITKGIELGAAKVDFLSGDTGWKQLWNFEKRPYYRFEKTVPL
ncbi:GNAT family N-acetyltransferase, partial [Candidatus Woesearchaeota archaeon]|nr:GNAT family N-acetyltransferase [Candidatus Woesearchaeota archaeon]